MLETGFAVLDTIYSAGPSSLLKFLNWTKVTFDLMEKPDSIRRHGRCRIASSEGKLVSMGGVGVKFKISGEQTGHAFSIVEHPVAPRTLVPPHVHHDTDEYSYST